MDEKLQQNDRDLIALLRDRLSLLAENQVPSREQQLVNALPLLEGAGVPLSVWESVVDSCDAVVPQLDSNVNNVTPRRITIVGGRGQMGIFFTRKLEAAGHKVSALGNQDWDNAETLLGDADLVIISVPIEGTVEIIRRVAQYIKPDTALADITSIKTQPVAAMLKYHSGPVMGLHPMFGPKVKSFAGQKVVVCQGRNDIIFQWLLDLMASENAELIVSTPEEHDQMMVVIQAIRQFSSFSLGTFLAQAKIDIKRSLLMSSPSYRTEIEILSSLFAQSPHLCADIMLATPERSQAITFLADIYSSLAKLVEQKDRTALIEEFEKTQDFFAEVLTNCAKQNSSQGAKTENHVNRHLPRYRLPLVSHREKASF